MRKVVSRLGRQNKFSCCSFGRPTREAVRETTLNLLRGSKFGPDTLLHWAAHAPNHGSYASTVVTEASMRKLSEGLKSLIRDLYCVQQPEQAAGRLLVHRLISSTSMEISIDVFVSDSMA